MNVQDLKFQSNEKLSVVQFRTEFINTFKYISLSEAIKKKHIEIKEVNESGSVNDLFVINHSEHFVFISDGDVLDGAKQNRVLNTSILLRPNSKVVLPVSCVEQGRWRYTKSDFTHSEYMAPTFMRSKKSSEVKANLERKKGFSADQRKIWEDVSRYEKKYNLKTSTSDLSGVYFYRIADFENSLEKFSVEKESNGIAIFLLNKLLSLEIFNQDKIYEEYFPKLLRGAHFETHNVKELENNLNEHEAFYKTVDFLDQTKSFQYDEYKGVAAGTERRFDTNNMTGFELNYENNTIHFVALNLKKESKE